MNNDFDHPFVKAFIYIGLFLLIIFQVSCSTSGISSISTVTLPEIEATEKVTNTPVATFQPSETPTIERYPTTIASTDTPSGTLDSQMPPEVQIIQLPPEGYITQEPSLPGATPVSGTTGTCISPNLTSRPSGVINLVTMAQDVSGVKLDPVNPTNTYAPDLTIHAVAGIVNAPLNTVFRAEWYVTNTGSGKYCNQLLDTSEVTTDGTRNIHFQLAHEQPFPFGSYRLQIYVNSTLDQVSEFFVK